MPQCCFKLKVAINNVAPVSTLACAKYQLQAHQVCTAQHQQSTTQCNQTAAQQYSSCSGWGIFSGLCIAWTWITNIVCVAWSTLVSWVCHAWAWIQNSVCVAWHWVTYWVQLGVLWLTYTVCRTVLWPCVLGWDLKCRRATDAPRNPLEKPGWLLSFEDDFSGPALDPTKWQDAPWFGARYLHDWASGTTPPIYLDPAGFSPGSGTIRLASTNQPLAGQTDANWTDPQTQQLVPFSIPYRGAWMMWPNPGQLDQQYGYFEIRCRTPTPPEAYPAFWLYSRYQEPEEIDIFEFNVNGTPDAYTTTVHWGPDKPGKKMKVKTHQVCRPWQIYHIYGCEWTPTRISWYRDNQLIRETKRKKIVSEFTYPLALIVSTGPDARPGHHPENGAYPNYFEVDYVRVYRRP